MKTIRMAIPVLILLSMISSTGYGQSISGEYNVDDSKIALDGYSPVSYIELNLAQRGAKEYMSEHKGLKYYFTNAEQKAKFDANPAKYLPQYGGWCATGIAVGAKFRTDPNKFLVRDGKLYLFLYNLEVDALQLWLGDEKKMKTNAEDNWKKLSK
ncbi:MAG: YHS domain-containing (seleno)protein [Candidatus Kapaibacterium sp.]